MSPFDKFRDIMTFMSIILKQLCSGYKETIIIDLMKIYNN